MPTSALDPRLLLTAATLLIATGLTLLGKRMRISGHDGCMHGLAAIALPVLIWVPHPWRDVLLVGVIALLVASEGGLYGFVAVAVVGGAVTWFVPGGASAMLLLLFALTVGWFEIYDGMKHLQQLRRMPHLDPGKQVAEIVEASGVARARESIVLPGIEEPLAAYEIRVGSKQLRSGTMQLETALGMAVFEPEGARLKLNKSKMYSKEEDLTALWNALGRAPLVDDVDDKQVESATVEYVPAGAEVCVQGLPSWRRDPRIGSYRGGALLPVFNGKQAMLTDRSAAQIRIDTRFAVVTWTLWGTLIATVAAYQIFS